MNKKAISIIKTLFSQKPVYELKTICEAIPNRSSRSIIRDLEQLGYYTSYNNTGRYYTLSNIPEFNKLGLWFYENAYFSKYGTITCTILHIINNSDDGKNQKELENILGVKIYRELNNLFKKKEICRKKIESSFVYLNKNKIIQKEQICKRLKNIKYQKELKQKSKVIFELITKDICNQENDVDFLFFSELNFSRNEEHISEIFKKHNLDYKNLNISDLEYFRNCFLKLLNQGKIGIHRTNGLQIKVNTSPGICPVCGLKLVFQKSVKRRVVTLKYGDFIAVEAVLTCENACTQSDGTLVTKRSDFLSSLIQPKGIYGYDIEVYVGLQKYLYFRQREEIISSLEEKYGISISTGEISNLAKRFLKHLSLLHFNKSDDIKNILSEDGGYPLHIDATVEQGKGTLFVAYAGWRKWVLGAWKISSERSELLEPCLERIDELFGTPCSIVRDLGRGMTLATSNFINKRKLNIPILACHLHFLRDVGKDILNENYDKLRKLFRSSSIISKLRNYIGKLINEKDIKVDIMEWLSQQNSQLPNGDFGKKVILILCQWVLDYKNESASGNFPFDLPHLEIYDRCYTMNIILQQFLKEKVEDKDSKKLIIKLLKILNPINNSNFKQITKTLKAQRILFDDLRNILRLESKLCCEENNNDTIESLNEIKECFERYETSLPQLKKEIDSSLKGTIDIICEHLNRHGEYLWGHIVKMSNQNENSVKLVERTNNILESFFHKLKHDERRRSGRKLLTCELESYPASATLVANLTKEDYVKTICGTLDSLPKLFSEIDASTNDNINKINNVDDPLKTYSSEIRKNKFSSLQDRKVVRSKELLKYIEFMRKKQ